MRRRRLAGLLVAMTCGAAYAIGEEATMLLPGDRVRSSLSAQGEEKTVAFAGVEGSTLSLAAKARGPSRVVPQIRVTDPDGAAVDVGETNPGGGRTAKARGIAVGRTGVWRVSVRTGKDQGGEFELSASAKVPLSARWKGLAGDPLALERLLAAAPGGSMTVVVAANPREVFAPLVRVTDPRGVEVASVTGAKGRVALGPLRLDALGRYRISVDAAGAAFSAKAVVKPATKRLLEFGDVEAVPDIRGFSPVTTDNQSVVTLTLDGIGFTTRQTVSVSAGTQTLAGAVVKSAGASSAVAELDLGAVPPGTWNLRVGTPGGKAVFAPTAIEVTNRAPTVGLVAPSDIWNADPLPFELRGAGFDPSAEVSIRHVPTGSLLDYVQGTRTSHTAIAGSITVPQYFVGACDVTVRDENGVTATLPGGLDLIGPSRAGAQIHQATLASVMNYGVDDVAVDTKRNRALVALHTVQVSWTLVLVDLATLAVLDTYTTNTQVKALAVAYDPVSDTFGIVFGAAYSTVVTVSAANIRQTLSTSSLGGGSSGFPDIAANHETGGFLAVVDEITVGSSRITVQPIPASALIDSAQRVSFVAPEALQYLHPSAAYVGGGNYFVVWTGPLDASFEGAGMFGAVVDGGGQVVRAANLLTTNGDWFFAVGSRAAADPATGRVLVAFSHYQSAASVVPRPDVIDVDPLAMTAGTPRVIDNNPHLPGFGYCWSLDWNPVREEFLLAYEAPLPPEGLQIVIRRFRPDGSPRGGDGYLAFEGRGAAYASDAVNGVGVVRVYDTVDNYFDNPYTQIRDAFIQPIR